jgi:hypothetical protein
MKLRSGLPMFAVAAALLGLIALLATLQYRWLGQVSAAERERMQASLAARADAFAQDFDREITRAYVTFQLDPLSDGANLSAHLGERYDRWQATSRYPRLVKQVYAVPRGTRETGGDRRAGADGHLQHRGGVRIPTGPRSSRRPLRAPHDGCRAAARP